MALAKIRPRRGAHTVYTQLNPLLEEGELVFVVPETGVGTGPSRVKLGDGEHRYNDLPFAIDSEEDTKYDLAANKNAGNNDVKITLTGSDSTTDSITIKGVDGAAVTTDANGVISIGAPTDTDTTYDLAANKNASNNNVKINLTGSDSSTDSITIKGTNGATVTTDANGVISVNAPTDTNTTYDLGANKSASNNNVKINLTGSDSSTDSVSISGTGSATVTTDVDGNIKVYAPAAGQAITYDLAANKSAGNNDVKITLTGSDSSTDDVTIKGTDGVTVTTDSDGVISVNAPSFDFGDEGTS